jgi:hypothetical protein
MVAEESDPAARHVAGAGAPAAAVDAVVDAVVRRGSAGRTTATRPSAGP